MPNRRVAHRYSLFLHASSLGWGIGVTCSARSRFRYTPSYLENAANMRVGFQSADTLSEFQYVNSAQMSKIRAFYVPQGYGEIVGGQLSWSDLK